MFNSCVSAPANSATVDQLYTAFEVTPMGNMYSLDIFNETNLENFIKSLEEEGIITNIYNEVPYIIDQGVDIAIHAKDFPINNGEQYLVILCKSLTESTSGTLVLIQYENTSRRLIALDIISK